MQIIDAHHHLWDLEQHHYPWLANPAPHPAGDPEPIRRSYRLADFLEDARHQELAKSVHLQAAMADPVQETAWLQSLADDPAGRGFPHAIVAFADLADPGVEAVLEQHCRYPNLRGIRFMVNHIEGEPLYCMTERGDWLRDAQWRRGYALLEKHGLSFDLQVYCHQMAEAADLAAAFPGIQVMLNHAGLPHRRDPDYVESWRRGMRILADRPNLAAKISGLGMFDHTGRSRASGRSCSTPSRPSGSSAACSRPTSRSTGCTATTTGSGQPSVASPPTSRTASAERCSTTTRCVYIACERKGVACATPAV
jgi:predicted TIM-barrel fold metal-dependent hydrolase